MTTSFQCTAALVACVLTLFACARHQEVKRTASLRSSPKVLCSDRADSRNIRSFRLPTKLFGYPDMILGAGNGIWVHAGNENGSMFTRISDNDTIEFPGPIESHLGGMSRGPNNTLWFTEDAKVGYMASVGSITEFPLPLLPSQAATPDPMGRKTLAKAMSITKGPDNNMWFTEPESRIIGKVTPTGDVHIFTPTLSGDPEVITSGTGKTLWFLESSAGKVGRISTSGLREFPITPSQGSSSIAGDSRGGVWVGPFVYGYLTHLSSTGTVQKHSIHGWPLSLVSAPNGNIWFTERLPARGKATTGVAIGKITPANRIVEYQAPKNLTEASMLAIDGNNNIWSANTGVWLLPDSEQSPGTGAITRYSKNFPFCAL